jgi:hypothetical protein
LGKVSVLLGPWGLVRGDRSFDHSHPVRLAYQPPASSTFLSEQISHQQPTSGTFLSEQTSTSHQPPVKRTDYRLVDSGHDKP